MTVDTELKMKTDNELIAEFMGAKINEERYGGSGWGIRTWEMVHPINNGVSVLYGTDMKYPTSWDWLMPVIEKISDLHDSTFHYDVEKIRKGDWPKDNEYMEVISLPMSIKIEETYKAIVKFIHWYNANKS